MSDEQELRLSQGRKALCFLIVFYYISGAESAEGRSQGRQQGLGGWKGGQWQQEGSAPSTLLASFTPLFMYLLALSCGVM